MKVSTNSKAAFTIFCDNILGKFFFQTHDFQMPVTIYSLSLVNRVQLVQTIITY